MSTSPSVAALGGRVYRVLGPLKGRGRFLAQVELGDGRAATVQLEQLLRAGMLSPKRLRALATQARQLKERTHPALVLVQDLVTVDGVPAVVTAHHEGAGLDTLLDGHPLSASAACALGAQLADALAAAHGASPPIVHGGLRSEAVRLTPDGRVRLAGFGLAAVIGEQAGVDAADDIYALGALVFELFAGRPLGALPLDADAHDAAAFDRIVALADLPGPLAFVLPGCLAFDAAARPSAADVAATLRDCIDDADGMPLDEWAPVALASATLLPRQQVDAASAPDDTAEEPDDEHSTRDEDVVRRLRADQDDHLTEEEDPEPTDELEPVMEVEVEDGEPTQFSSAVVPPRRSTMQPALALAPPPEAGPETFERTPPDALRNANVRDDTDIAEDGPASYDAQVEDDTEGTPAVAMDALQDDAEDAAGPEPTAQMATPLREPAPQAGQPAASVADTPSADGANRPPVAAPPPPTRVRSRRPLVLAAMAAVAALLAGGWWGLRHRLAAQDGADTPTVTATDARAPGPAAAVRAASGPPTVSRPAASPAAASPAAASPAAASPAAASPAAASPEGAPPPPTPVAPTSSRIVVKVPFARSVVLSCGEKLATGAAIVSLPEPPQSGCSVRATFEDGEGSATFDAESQRSWTCERTEGETLLCR